MMHALMEAARAAREASDNDGYVEIVLTEEGLIIRGERGETLRRRRASMDVRWPEFDADQAMPQRAVWIVNRELRGLG